VHRLNAWVDSARGGVRRRGDIVVERKSLA
jgi:hypothetical protein